MKEDDDLSISKTLSELQSSVEHSLPSMRARLDVFLEAFNTSFHGAHESGSAVALTWALMSGPITLYALELNGAALIELHAILERFALRDLSEYVAKPKQRQVFDMLVDRRGLLDCAIAYVKLGVWDKKDQKFCIDLNRVRNGVAHKNPRTLSNALRTGRPLQILDIDQELAHVDVVPYILATIRLLIKLSKEWHRAKHD